jgi:hypothetical protein
MMQDAVELAVADEQVASGTFDRYADLSSRGRTEAAHKLSYRVYQDISEHERTSSRRVRERRARTGLKLVAVLERFVGDLLRARTNTNTTGRIYRPVGKNAFNDAPVTYDMFKAALDGLKASWAGGASQRPQPVARYGFGFRMTVPGQAARFWVTARLIELAEEHGIHGGNVDDHFFPEPPIHPLVLRDYAAGRGQNKERGRIIKYERTPEVEQLERDVRELNDFLAHVKLTGGRHEGYQRTFNNAAWNQGGRLYSIGDANYQLLPEEKRLEMTINGEAVAEIDIKASHLTIFHASVGEALDPDTDPHARVVGVTRDVAKRWCVETFGNSAPKTRWSAELIREYRERGEICQRPAWWRKPCLRPFRRSRSSARTRTSGRSFSLRRPRR